MTQKLHYPLPKGYKNTNLKVTCTLMFIAGLSIVKLWKEPKCLSTDEWIKKSGMCVCMHVHTHTHNGIYTHIHIHT